MQWPRAFQRSPGLLKDGYKVAGYWAMNGELPLHRVLTALRAFRAATLVPPADGLRRAMAASRFGALVDRAIRWSPNRYGIPEPDLVKSLNSACWRRKSIGRRPFAAAGLRPAPVNRIGHAEAVTTTAASGSCATAIAAREPLLVGVGYAFQEVPKLDPESWDIKLDFVCTEDELIECGKR